MLRKILPTLLAMLLSVSAFAATTAVVTPGTWDGYRGSSIVTEDAPSEAACVAALKALNVQRNYTCRTRTVVAVTITPDPPPPPAPVDCVVSGPVVSTGPWSMCVSGVQSRTVTSTLTVVTPPANGGLACPVLVTTTTESQSCAVDPPPVDPPVTGNTFYGPSSAPACVLSLTKYSWDGRVRTSTHEQRSISTIANRVGRCLEATPTTLGTVWQGVQPGDYITLRAGTYNKVYGDETWYQDGTLGTNKKGTAAQPISLVGAPGELVIFKNAGGHSPFIFGSEGRGKADYIEVAGVQIDGEDDCIAGGGNTQAGSSAAETGGTNIRIVGNVCSVLTMTDNTMTGALSVQGDGWYIRGNIFRDKVGRAIFNNNHGVYIQNGADNAVVQDNDFQMHIGHVVQIHQDGTSMQYDNLLVKDNYIHGLAYGDMRGIAMINVKSSSTLKIEGNRIEHQGQGGWGCLNIYFGTATVTGLECVDSEGGVQVNGQSNGSETSSNGFRKVLLDGAKLCPVAGRPRLGAENGASLSQIIETNPKSCP